MTQWRSGNTFRILYIGVLFSGAHGVTLHLPAQDLRLATQCVQERHLGLCIRVNWYIGSTLGLALMDLVNTEGRANDFTDAGEEGGVVMVLAVEGELVKVELEELDAEEEAACVEGEVVTVGWAGTSAELKSATLRRGSTPGSMSCIRWRSHW
ncbi:hypothetical protein FB451DRAFT_1177962 [Mycena latifolia]|nr:hypothetical protein FB451DRAFT_1177962 [Mycena latifolia]